MDNEEQLKYKVVLDAEDVPSYLESLKQQINTVLESTGRGGFQGTAGLPFGSLPTDMSFASPNIQQIGTSFVQPIPIQPIQMQGLQNIPMQQNIGSLDFSQTAPIMTDLGRTQDTITQWFKDTSEVLQQGYYKSRDAWQSIRSAAALARYKFENTFNRDVTPLSQQSPTQLLGGALGFGYDPFLSTQSPGEYSLQAEQRLADNTSLGMMDFTFGELVTEGAIVGSTIGSVGGLTGTGIGAAAGAVVGAGLWTTNAIVRPFKEEAIFTRNITRGLKGYTPYTIAGAMPYEERAEIAEYLRNRDLSQELLGQGVGRDDIENMFKQLTQTSYFQRSTNADDMIDKIRTFTRDFSQIMHIYKVAKEDVGKIVDSMDEAGIIDYMGGNLGAAARFIESVGFAGRMDASQATQLFQSGSEMLRGTGINMGAGGNLLLSTLTDIRNELRSNELNPETVRQLGGDIQASFTASKNIYDTANSPGGLMFGIAREHGQMNLGGTATNYLSGIGNISSYSDYLSESYKVIESYGKPGAMEEVAFNLNANKLIAANNMFNFSDDPEEKRRQMIAYYSMTEKKSIPEATLIVDNLLMSPETREKKFIDKVTAQEIRNANEEYSWWSKATDTVSNAITRFWRDNIQISGSNTEVNTETQDLFGGSSYIDMATLQNKNIFGSQTYINENGKLTTTRSNSTSPFIGKSLDFLPEAEEAWGEIYKSASKLFRNPNDWKRGYKSTAEKQDVDISEGSVERFVKSALGLTMNEPMDNLATEMANLYYSTQPNIEKSQIGFTNYMSSVLTLATKKDFHTDFDQYLKDYKVTSNEEDLLKEFKSYNIEDASRLINESIELRKQATSGDKNAEKEARKKELAVEFIYKTKGQVEGDEYKSYTSDSVKIALEDMARDATKLMSITGTIFPTGNTILTGEDIAKLMTTHVGVLEKDFKGSSEEWKEVLAIREKAQKEIGGSLVQQAYQQRSAANKYDATTFLKDAVKEMGDWKVRLPGQEKYDTSFKDALEGKDEENYAAYRRQLYELNPHVGDELKNIMERKGMKATDVANERFLFNRDPQEEALLKGASINAPSMRDVEVLQKEFETIQTLNRTAGEFRTSIGINGETVTSKNTEDAILATGLATKEQLNITNKLYGVQLAMLSVLKRSSPTIVKHSAEFDAELDNFNIRLFNP